MDAILADIRGGWGGVKVGIYLDRPTVQGVCLFIKKRQPKACAQLEDLSMAYMECRALLEFINRQNFPLWHGVNLCGLAWRKRANPGDSVFSPMAQQTHQIKWKSGSNKTNLNPLFVFRKI